MGPCFTSEQALQRGRRVPLSVPKKVTHTFWVVTSASEWSPQKWGLMRGSHYCSVNQMSTCLPAACSDSPSCPLCPRTSELKLRREEERRIKLAVSRGVCLLGDILTLHFGLLSNSWLSFLSIPSAGITGMTHHTWEVRSFIICPVCH